MNRLALIPIPDDDAAETLLVTAVRADIHESHGIATEEVWEAEIDVPADDQLTRALDDLTTFVLRAAKTGAVSDAYRDAADLVRAVANLDEGGQGGTP